jgi:hypothetical protein
MVPNVDPGAGRDKEYVADNIRMQKRIAAAFDVGTSAIESGKAKSVEEVNALVNDRLPKAREFDSPRGDGE